MYKVLAYASPTSRDPHRIHDPLYQKSVIAGKLSVVENAVDSLALTVGPDNWLYANGESMQTHIEIYEDRKNLIFRGRLFDVTKSMGDDGKFEQTFTFESIFNYLKDSVQRWEKMENVEPRDLLQKMLDVHNSQVPEYEQFTLRNFSLKDESKGSVYRYINYGSTWDQIKETMIESLGGVVSVEYTPEGNFLDYEIYNQGDQNPDAIKVSRNLKSMSVDEDPTDVITRLVPLGATLEDTDRQQTSNPRLTIKDVNGGKDYIDIPDMQKSFTTIVGVQIWDDITDPKALKAKAEDWIKDQSGMHAAYEVSALELPNFDKFRVSQTYQIINPHVMTPQYVRVIQKDIDLLDPYNSSLTIGDRNQTLTEYQYMDEIFKNDYWNDGWDYDDLSDAFDDLNENFDDLMDKYEDLKDQYDDYVDGIDGGSDGDGSDNGDGNDGSDGDSDGSGDGDGGSDGDDGDSDGDGDSDYPILIKMIPIETVADDPENVIGVLSRSGVKNILLELEGWDTKVDWVEVTWGAIMDDIINGTDTYHDPTEQAKIFRKALKAVVESDINLVGLVYSSIQAIMGYGEGNGYWYNYRLSYQNLAKTLLDQHKIIDPKKLVLVIPHDGLWLDPPLDEPIRKMFLDDGYSLTTNYYYNRDWSADAPYHGFDTPGAKYTTYADLSLGDRDKHRGKPDNPYDLFIYNSDEWSWVGELGNDPSKYVIYQPVEVGKKSGLRKLLK